MKVICICCLVPDNRNCNIPHQLGWGGGQCTNHYTRQSLLWYRSMQPDQTYQDKVQGQCHSFLVTGNHRHLDQSTPTCRGLTGLGDLRLPLEGHGNLSNRSLRQLCSVLLCSSPAEDMLEICQSSIKEVLGGGGGVPGIACLHCQKDWHWPCPLFQYDQSRHVDVLPYTLVSSQNQPRNSSW